MGILHRGADILWGFATVFAIATFLLLVTPGTDDTSPTPCTGCNVNATEGEGFLLANTGPGGGLIVTDITVKEYADFITPPVLTKAVVNSNAPNVLEFNVERMTHGRTRSWDIWTTVEPSSVGSAPIVLNLTGLGVLEASDMPAQLGAGEPIITNSCTFTVMPIFTPISTPCVVFAYPHTSILIFYPEIMNVTASAYEPSRISPTLVTSQTHADLSVRADMFWFV